MPDFVRFAWDELEHIARMMDAGSPGQPRHDLGGWRPVDSVLGASRAMCVRLPFTLGDLVEAIYDETLRHRIKYRRLDVWVDWTYIRWALEKQPVEEEGGRSYRFQETTG